MESIEIFKQNLCENGELDKQTCYRSQQRKKIAYREKSSKQQVNNKVTAYTNIAQMQHLHSIYQSTF